MLIYLPCLQVGAQRGWLRGVHLGAVDWSGRSLRGAKLQNCDLAGSNLSGADLSKANLTDTNLEGTSAHDG